MLAGAMEYQKLPLRAQVAQLERDLAVAQNRMRDLTEINSLFQRIILDPAPAKANKIAKSLPPPEHPPRPESRQCSMPLPGHSCLSSPALVTCHGESVPAGVGIKKSHTHAPFFDSSDRELYKH